MIVRDLITELLDCDLDAEVSIEINTQNMNFDESDFYIDETDFGKRKFVSLKHDSDNLEIIEKGELQALKDRIDELEDELND